MKGLLKFAGIEETKICTSTSVVTGCGAVKPITDFPKTKCSKQPVCKECVEEYRKNRFKAEQAITPETKLHNELSRIWR